MVDGFEFQLSDLYDDRRYLTPKMKEAKRPTHDLGAKYSSVIVTLTILLSIQCEISQSSKRANIYTSLWYNKLWTFSNSEVSYSRHPSQANSCLVSSIQCQYQFNHPSHSVRQYHPSIHLSKIIKSLILPLPCYSESSLSD